MEDERLIVEVRTSAVDTSVFDAVSSDVHIRRWWTDTAELSSQVGGIGVFRWPRHGWVVKVAVVERVPSSRMVWRCVESNMQGTDAWVGTLLVFGIEVHGRGSRLLFAQRGYRASPCRAVCAVGWRDALVGSLHAYLETGEGRPYLA